MAGRLAGWLCGCKRHQRERRPPPEKPSGRASGGERGAIYVRPGASGRSADLGAKASLDRGKGRQQVEGVACRRERSLWREMESLTELQCGTARQMLTGNECPASSPVSWPRRKHALAETQATKEETNLRQKHRFGRFTGRKLARLCRPPVAPRAPCRIRARVSSTPRVCPTQPPCPRSELQPCLRP